MGLNQLVHYNFEKEESKPKIEEEKPQQLLASAYTPSKEHRMKRASSSQANLLTTKSMLKKDLPPIEEEALPPKERPEKRGKDV